MLTAVLQLFSSEAGKKYEDEDEGKIKWDHVDNNNGESTARHGTARRERVTVGCCRFHLSTVVGYILREWRAISENLISHFPPFRSVLRRQRSWSSKTSSCSSSFAQTWVVCRMQSRRCLRINKWRNGGAERQAGDDAMQLHNCTSHKRRTKEEKRITTHTHRLIFGQVYVLFVWRTWLVSKEVKETTLYRSSRFQKVLENWELRMEMERDQRWPPLYYYQTMRDASNSNSRYHHECCVVSYTVHDYTLHVRLSCRSYRRFRRSRRHRHQGDTTDRCAREENNR